MKPSLACRSGLLALLLLTGLPVQAQELLRTLQSPVDELQGRFGFPVAGVPDATGDGRGDLLVGALFEDPGASPNDAGRAYLFNGATGALLLSLKSPNEEASGFFGVAAAGVPDVNGDGRGDVLVGAPGEDPGANPDGTGRVYLFRGSNGNVLRTLKSPNQEVSGSFGHVVAGVPDANGDGRGDLLVGAPNEDPGASPDGAGRAYLFSGATGALLFTFASPNEEASGFFGVSAAGVPDVNGDGRGDVLVGARSEDPGASPDGAGRAYLFSGATGALLFTFASPQPETGGNFGVAVAGAPDLTGDGRGDVIVGANFEDPGTSPDNAGRAHVFNGATGAFVRTLRSTMEANFGLFGVYVSGVPDLNNDGRGEVIVGAQLEDLSFDNAGAAYVFSGATGGLLGKFKSPNAEVSGSFGVGVAGVPDTNGDARGDLLIGAFQEDPGASPEFAGRAYLFSLLPRIVVQQPANATVWTAGTSQKVKWTSAGLEPGGRVRIALQDGPTTMILSSPRNKGSWNWAIPAGLTCTDCTIRITSLEDPAAFDESEPFDIVGPGGALEAAGKTAGAPEETPQAFALEAAYPNPFNPQTTIGYALAEPVFVRLDVYDLLGRRVRVLVDEAQGAGRYEVRFDAAGLPGGVYLCRIEAGSFRQVRHLLLAK